MCKAVVWVGKFKNNSTFRLLHLPKIALPWTTLALGTKNIVEVGRTHLLIKASILFEVSSSFESFCYSFYPVHLKVSKSRKIYVALITLVQFDNFCRVSFSPIKIKMVMICSSFRTWARPYDALGSFLSDFLR